MKSRFFLLTALVLIVSFRAEASHIVGGEFQIIHVTNYSYEISLIIYFDENNGNPEAEDLNVVARIFRSRDGHVMGDVILPLIARNTLNPTIISCSIGELRIRKLTYRTTYNLSAEFDDPEGYYIAWERCCRNYNITNIYSENTQAGGTRYAGQTFFLHFPPVKMNGNSFFNSSPELFPVFSDYTCIGRPFVADFSARDADGDQLKYSIVTPLSTHSSLALPAQIQPAPFPKVTYRPSFSADNLLGGASQMKIDNNGILSVVADKQGLFAFAVKCEEFRDGIKIGEVVREYQLLVTDACPPAIAPSIEAKSAGGVYTTDALDVYFNESVPAESRCFSVRVKDQDNYLNPNEKLRLRAVPLDFQENLSGILPEVNDTHLTSAEASAEFKICFTNFPRQRNRDTYTLAIIAFDETCSIGLSDTVKILLTLDLTDLPEEPQSRLEQQITFQAIDEHTIGDPAFSLSAQSTSGLPINYVSDNPAIASVSGSVVTMHQAGAVTIIATQPGNQTYAEAKDVKQVFCVKPKPPTLSLFRSASGHETIFSSSANNIWFRDNVKVPTSGNTIAVEGALSAYSASIMVSGCMSDPSESLLITGIQETRRTQVHVYPNPVAEELNISVSDSDGQIRVGLMDVSGKVVATSIGAYSNLAVSKLKPGVYFLTVQVGADITRYKILKQ